MFVGRFSPNFDPINNYYFALVVNRVKNPIITDTNSITLPICKLYYVLRTRIRREGKEDFVYGGSMVARDFSGFFLGPSFYDYPVTHGESQFLRNFS